LVDDFCDGANEQIVRAFEDAAGAIHESLGQDKRVLVHCMGGISRSATAVIWYLIRYEGYTWEDAAALLRDRRSVTNPDICFELALRLSREQLDEEWLTQRIEEYVADYRRRGRSDRGRNLDAEFVRSALVRQGTLQSPN
jgi:protein-tyrosine phosphatase